MLSRTQSMFAYTGLPDTIPASKLELMLQTKGYAFVTEVNGNLYALYGGLGGEPDVYEDSTEITVSNTALKLSKTYNIENDGVLVNNDVMQLGLLPILNKYGALLAENTISIHTVDIILRMVCMISASDDRTYTGALKFIDDIEKGKLSAIGESAFFDGGALSSNESALNDDFLLPLVDNMIKERQTAIEKINEKYNLDISIDFASAWKVTHEENEKQIALSETIQEQINNGNEIDVTVDEKQGVHDNDRPLIKIKGDNDESGSERTKNEATADDTDTDREYADKGGNEDTTGEETDSAGTNEESTNESDKEIEETDTNTEDVDISHEDDAEPTPDSDTEGEASGSNEEIEDKDNDRDKN